MSESKEKELTLIKVRNPFSRGDRDVMPAAYRRGETLLDIRVREFPLDVDVVVSLNGRIVRREELALTLPMAGDQILFVPEVHGGDGDSGLRTVLMLAVTVAAYAMLGPGGAGLTGGQFTAAMMATQIVGGMLVNSLLPPPKPDLPTLDSLANSQTYSWAPQTTQRQGVAIPKFYGTNKLYGNIIGAFLQNTGTESTINALIGLNMGMVKRLYDFKINDQHVEAFRGVQLYENRGTLDQGPLLPFQTTKIEYPQWVKIVKDSPFTYTTQGDSFDELEIEISFPLGLWMQPPGFINKTPTSIDAAIDIRRAGSSDSWTPLLTQRRGSPWGPDGLMATEGHWSIGIWTHVGGYWLEFSATSSTNPYKHRELEGVGFLVGIYCYYHWLTPGEKYNSYDSQIVNYQTFTGLSTKPLKQTFRTDGVLSPGKYEIRVTNYTEDYADWLAADDLYLSSVREVSRDSFNYPRLAHVAVKALATDQLSGSLRFSCTAECSYVRYWDGAAWVYDASENPAWCAWDALTQPVIDAKTSDALLAGYEYYNTAVGLSFRVLRYDGKNPSKLDLPAWTAWAAFCDALVPDGNGGTEKRITFNGGFDTTTSTWEAAQQIAQVGRAVIVPTGDGYTVAVDMPGTPVQMFTVGNIGLDSFKETFLKQTDRASSLTMDFIDRDAGYERNTFTVMLPDIPGTNSASMPLVGCTKASEAWRHGMYRLYCNLYIARSAELAVGIDAIACVKGDLVNIQHDVPQWGFGGRLVSATVDTVTLDQEVTIAAGKSYTVMVRLMNDSVVSRSVTNAPGAYTVLTVSTPFSSVPAQYDPYAFGETSKVVKPFRVLNIKKTQDQECTLSLIEYNESVYGADAGQPVLPTSNYSALESLPAVTELLLDELLISTVGGGVEDVLDVYFTRPESAHYFHAEIWFDVDGGGWTYAGSTTAARFRIPGVQVGRTYTVAVRTVNLLGDRMKTENAPQASITTLGKLDPPSNVTNFTGQQNGQSVLFSWTPIPDADVAYYEIRQGASWESGRAIASGLVGDRFSWQAELNGAFPFMIKAFDSSGIESVAAASVDLTIRNIDEELNIVLSRDEITKPGGPDGAMTNFVFVSDIPALMLPHTILDTEFPSGTDTSAGISAYEGDIDLHAEYESLAMDTGLISDVWTRILATIDAYDRGATDQSYPTRTDMSYPADTDTHITRPVPFSFYARYSDDNVVWTAWEQYLGTVQKHFRYAKIKFICDLTSQTGVLKLKNLLASFDVPDVELLIPGFAVSAGTGNDLSFSTYGVQFHAEPLVTATVVGGAVNKGPVVSNKTASGFHIDLRDKTDAAVAGTVDMRVSGY